MHGAHCLAHWSRTQSNVALSSGEAELNGALKGGVELLGGRSLLADMSRSVSLRLKGDSAACKGTLLREGAGKLKHVQVKQLWLQECVGEGTIAIEQVPRERNPADTFTHHWSSDGVPHFKSVNVYF